TGPSAALWPSAERATRAVTMSSLFISTRIRALEQLDLLTIRRRQKLTQRRGARVARNGVLALGDRDVHRVEVSVDRRSGFWSHRAALYLETVEQDLPFGLVRPG